MKFRRSKKTALAAYKSCMYVCRQMIGDFHKITEGSKGTVTSARKLYEAKYCDEIRLNEEFKTFVANYRLVYEGANTVSSQIGVKYSTGMMCR